MANTGSENCSKCQVSSFTKSVKWLPKCAERNFIFLAALTCKARFCEPWCKYMSTKSSIYAIARQSGASLCLPNDTCKSYSRLELWLCVADWLRGHISYFAGKNCHHQGLEIVLRSSTAETRNRGAKSVEPAARKDNVILNAVLWKSAI